MSATWFPHASASHPQWHEATARVVAQLRIQMAQPAYASPPRVGLVYLTDSFAADAADILAQLQAGLPTVQQWAGATGVGVVGQQAMHFDVPALSVMLLDFLPQDCRVFSGVAPLPARMGARDTLLPSVNWALVHADPATPELTELVGELAARTRQHQLYGGLVASRSVSTQIAWVREAMGPASQSGVLYGGMSGLAFSGQVPLHAAFAHGTVPLGPVHRITACEDHLVFELDGRPALEVLLETLGVSLEDDMVQALETVRSTLVGIARHPQVAHPLDETTWVRGILGLDGVRQGVALTERVQQGYGLVFCRVDATHARAELMRACAEIREALSPPWTAHLEQAPLQERRIRGVVYVCCSARGSRFWSEPQAELQMLRAALGDEVPITGFYAAGEVMHDRVHAYGGLLLVLSAHEAPPAET